jgi:hypothetical protein
LLAELAGQKSLEPGVERFLCPRIEIPTKVEHTWRRPCPHQRERIDRWTHGFGLCPRGRAGARGERRPELPRPSALSGSRLGELSPEPLSAPRRVQAELSGEACARHRSSSLIAIRTLLSAVASVDWRARNSAAAHRQRSSARGVKVSGSTLATDRSHSHTR